MTKQRLIVNYTINNKNVLIRTVIVNNHLGTQNRLNMDHF